MNRKAILKYKVLYYGYKNYKNCYIESYGKDDDHALINLFHKLSMITTYEHIIFDEKIHTFNHAIGSDLDCRYYAHKYSSPHTKAFACMSETDLFKQVL